MTKLPVFDHKGTKLTSMTVADGLFAAKINQALMDQAVRVYLSSQRRGLAKSKRRGEVKVTKAKVWRQKGTGRARHGSRNAPVFVGGGKAHGPTGEQNLKQPTRNLKLITPLPAINLNTYQALRAEKLIFTKEAVKNLQKHYGLS